MHVNKPPLHGIQNAGSRKAAGHHRSCELTPRWYVGIDTSRDQVAANHAQAGICAEAEHAPAPGEGKNAASNRKKRETAAAKKREAAESGGAEEPADVASQDTLLQEPHEPVEETANVIPPVGASTRRTR